ncbi:hypothetical protein BKA62DRAFT_661017 [Auriculariales sp. MPI-PUGE-AT-0066]|nr:hypothetical protein BKA62DRAFT_661017 [Auriculariales sp. MPI-PUGE-AT-0066]
MAVEIKLYDINSNVGAWSPSVFKTRFALNLKKIPYETRWLKISEIPEVAKSVGAAATGKIKGTDEPWYTCPFIQVSLPGVEKPTVVTESSAIADFIDAHPAFNDADTPKLFPPGTRALQEAFIGNLWGGMLTVSFLKLAVSGSATIMEPGSADAEYVRKTRTAWFGGRTDWFGPRAAEKSFQPEEWVPAGSVERAEAWKETQDGFGKTAVVYKTTHKEGLGPWLMGSAPIFADILVLSYLAFFQRTVTDEEWAKVMEWDDGVWKTVWEAGAPIMQKLD